VRKRKNRLEALDHFSRHASMEETFEGETRDAPLKIKGIEFAGTKKGRNHETGRENVKGLGGVVKGSGPRCGCSPQTTHKSR